MTALHRGLIHHQQGELVQARRAYRKVLKSNPRDPDALRLLATVEMQRGRHAQAEQCARKALRAADDKAASHNTLGQILCAQGRYPEACAAFEQALNLDLTLANARANLGRCRLRMGDVPTGIADMCAALEQAPGDPAIACEIASVLMNCGEYAAAEAHFFKALEWAPDSFVSYLNLGACYVDQNKPDLAIPYLTKAVELQPADVSVWMNLSYALRQLGEPDAALESLAQVLSLQPDNSDALAMTASIHHQRGQYDKARQQFAAVLQSHPGHVMAAQGMAELHEWSGDYAMAIQCLQPIVEAGGYPPSVAVTYARALRRNNRTDEAVQLLEQIIPDDGPGIALARPLLQQAHFTLANLYDDLGKFESAWQHVTAANAMRPESFDAAAHSAQVDRIIESSDAGADVRADVVATSERQDERPIFIVGMPRSGTSLVEQILAAHPQVYALGETGFVGAAVPGEHGDIARIRSAFDELAGAAPVDSVRVTEKTPLNFLLLGAIQSAFPDARIIHCTRHPLDTMLSCLFTDFRARGLSFSSELDTLAHYYCEYQRLMQHWRSTLTIAIQEVQYEELVGNPETAIRRLIGFAGLEWHGGCLEHYRCKRTVHTASHAQVREPIYTRAVGRWRNYAEFLRRAWRYPDVSFENVACSVPGQELLPHRGSRQSPSRCP